MLIKTKNEKETINLGKNIIKYIKIPCVIVLSGDLGAGKTTLSKGIAKALNITELITSPTFTILNEYKTSKTNLYHFDMYRLNSLDEALELGFDEYFNKNDGVILVEWEENVKGLIKKPYYKITIKKKSNNEREINLEEIL